MQIKAEALRNNYAVTNCHHYIIYRLYIAHSINHSHHLHHHHHHVCIACDNFVDSPSENCSSSVAWTWWGFIKGIAEQREGDWRASIKRALLSRERDTGGKAITVTCVSKDLKCWGTCQKEHYRQLGTKQYNSSRHRLPRVAGHRQPRGRLSVIVCRDKTEVYLTISQEDAGAISKNLLGGICQTRRSTKL